MVKMASYLEIARRVVVERNAAKAAASGTSQPSPATFPIKNEPEPSSTVPVPSTRPATCASSCYEADQGAWIHHPWDGCRTPMPSTKPASAPKKEPWPVRCSLCGSVLPGLVEGVEHFRQTHCGRAAAPKTSESLFGTPKGNGDSK
jgi:hypothetical protein